MRMFRYYFRKFLQDHQATGVLLHHLADILQLFAQGLGFGQFFFNLLYCGAELRQLSFNLPKGYLFLHENASNP